MIIVLIKPLYSIYYSKRQNNISLHSYMKCKPTFAMKTGNMEVAIVENVNFLAVFN